MLRLSSNSSTISCELCLTDVMAAEWRGRRNVNVEAAEGPPLYGVLELVGVDRL
jgi:hypothetical protein